MEGWRDQVLFASSRGCRVEGLEGGSGRVEIVPNRTAPNIRIPK